MTGVGFASLYEYIFSRNEALALYGLIFLFLAGGELFRMTFPNSFVAELALRITQSLARSYEQDHASGMVFFVAGMLISISLLPKQIAVLSILFLSIGDPVASACGIKYGRLGPKFSNGKSLVGYLGGLFACALTTYFYFLRIHPHSFSLIAVSLLGGIAGELLREYRTSDCHAHS